MRGKHQEMKDENGVYYDTLKEIIKINSFSFRSKLFTEEGQAWEYSEALVLQRCSRGGSLSLSVAQVHPLLSRIKTSLTKTRGCYGNTADCLGFGATVTTHSASSYKLALDSFVFWFMMINVTLKNALYAAVSQSVDFWLSREKKDTVLMNKQ